MIVKAMVVLCLLCAPSCQYVPTMHMTTAELEERAAAFDEASNHLSKPTSKMAAVNKGAARNNADEKSLQDVAPSKPPDPAVIKLTQYVQPVIVLWCCPCPLHCGYPPYTFPSHQPPTHQPLGSWMDSDEETNYL